MDFVDCLFNPDEEFHVAQIHTLSVKMLLNMLLTFFVYANACTTAKPKVST